MQKKHTKLFILCFHFFLTSLALANGQRDEGYFALRSSRATFSEFMADPSLRNLFSDLQHRYLSSNSDRDMRKFISKRPVLKSIVHAFVNHDRIVNQESNPHSYVAKRGNELGEIRPTKKGPYAAVYSLLKRTAVDLGFSPQAIRNLRVYVENGLNASAVSKTADQIVIVLGSELIKNFNFIELRTVFAHELAHIKNQHSIESFIEKILNSLVLEIYSNGVPDQLRDDLLGRLLNYMKLITGGPEKEITSSRPHGESEPRIVSRETLGMVIENAFRSLISLERVALDDLMMGFLATQLNRMKEMKATSEDISFYELCLQLYPFDHQDRNRLSIEDLLFHMNRAKNALSQAQEETADRFGASLTSSDQAASSIAAATLFASLDFRTTKGNRSSILEQVENDWKRVQLQFSEDEIAAHSFDSTHPKNVPRIVRIMETPAYPAILFANPFLRLLLLEDELNLRLSLLSSDPRQQTQIQKVSSLLSKLQSRIFYLISHFGIEDRSSLGDPANPRFDNFVQFITSQLELRRQIQRTHGVADETLQGKDKSYLETHRLYQGLIASLRTELNETPFWSYKRKSRIRNRLEVLVQIAAAQSEKDLQKIRRGTSPKSETSSDGIRSSRIPVDLVTSCRSKLLSKK